MRIANIGFWVCLWAMGSCPLRAGASTADSLFQAAVGQLDRVSVEEGLDAFRRVLKADGGYAPAYQEIARLQLARHTIQGRTEAEQAIRKAIRLDSENVEYQLTYGEVMWAQGFWSNAERHFREIMESHGENPRAAYMVGYHAFKNFMKYKDMQSLDATLDAIVGPDSLFSSRIVSWNPFGDEAYEMAVEYLNRSIEVDPDFRDAYYQLGLTHFENDRPSRLIRLSHLLLKRQPDDKDALLFSGLGHQTLGNQREAYEFYARALDRMSPEERAVMERVDVLIGREDSPEIRRASAEATSGVWSDNPVLDRFWHRQDPLYLTDFNERRMEHYGRVAYANLRFSQPSRGVAGWQTDMGKAYIKFGRYRQRITQRPEIDAAGVIPHLEMWFYEGFKVTFRNGDGLDGWRFDVGSMTEPTGLAVFKQTPPRYVDPYQQKKYTTPYQVAAFQEEDKIRLELSYVIPKSRIRAAQYKELIDMEEGIFFFNEAWTEIRREVHRAVRLTPWPRRPKWWQKTPENEHHLVTHPRLYVDPGPGRVVLEVLDPRSGAIGTFQEFRAFSVADTQLAVSDLMLATRIDPRSPSPEGRGDLDIIPNPTRTYHGGEPVFIYLEIYNLARDAYGRTGYDIAYRLGPPRKEEIDPRLFEVQDLPDAHAYVEIETVIQGEDATPPDPFDRPGPSVDYRVQYVLPERNQVSSQVEQLMQGGEGAETAVTARYEGDREDDFTYLQIDVGQMPIGIHKLTVSVTDVATGRRVARDVLFRVTG